MIEKIKIYSDKYFIYKDQIKEPHLLKLYERYFHAILKSFEELGNKIKKYIFFSPWLILLVYRNMNLISAISESASPEYEIKNDGREKLILN